MLPRASRMIGRMAGGVFVNGGDCWGSCVSCLD